MSRWLEPLKIKPEKAMMVESMPKSKSRSLRRFIIKRFENLLLLMKSQESSLKNKLNSSQKETTTWN
jgi:hypothetical protein